MWLKIDDGYADHPKVEAAIVQAGPGVVLVHLRLMCYAAKHLTDGLVPDAAAERLSFDIPGSLKALQSVGLIRHVNAGWGIADWLDYNPPAAEVKAQRKARSDRGKRGAAARWDAKGDAPSNATSNAPSIAVGIDNALAPVPVPSRTRPVPVQEEHGALDEPLVRPERTALAVGFETAWNAYPRNGRRSLKGESLKRWKSYRLTEHASNVLAWIAACKLDDDWKKDGGAFIPGMQVWLRARRDDFSEPPEQTPTAAQGHHGWPCQCGDGQYRHRQDGSCADCECEKFQGAATREHGEPHADA